MVSGLVWFLMYSKIGMLNRMMIGLIGTNVLTFVSKGYFYSQVIEQAGDELSLVGQEARIQLRYYFPEHPKYEIFQSLQQQYLELSEKHRDTIEDYRKSMLKEANKDEDFYKELKKNEK
mmetsp:Transcript_11506/g.10178  ORF Transcript_11506/g.10178 Transcript_11506/m.10178 type:complete len:119 (-) Transcript_11506:27-383(-)